jgi:hypothetical protein
MRANPAVVNGAPRSEVNTNGDLGILLPGKPAQGAQFVAANRMRRRRAPLRPADGQRAGVEVDLVPAEIDQLGHPESVPIGHEDHGRVPVAPTVISGGLLQAADLAVGEVFPGPEFSVWKAPGCNCSIFGAWRHQTQVLFCHDNPPPGQIDCLYNGSKTNSQSLPRVVGRLSPAVGVLAALGEADPGRASRNNPAAGSELQTGQLPSDSRRAHRGAGHAKPLLGEMKGR